MKPDTIKIKLDFMGKPFIVDACNTDGNIKKLSTEDWMEEEINNVGLEDTLYGQKFENGIYKVIADGSWNYEHTEYDYDIIYTRIKDDKQRTI